MKKSVGLLAPSPSVQRLNFEVFSCKESCCFAVAGCFFVVNGLLHKFSKCFKKPIAKKKPKRPRIGLLFITINY